MKLSIFEGFHDIQDLFQRCSFQMWKSFTWFIFMFRILQSEEWKKEVSYLSKSAVIVHDSHPYKMVLRGIDWKTNHLVLRSAQLWKKVSSAPIWIFAWWIHFWYLCFIISFFSKEAAQVFKFSGVGYSVLSIVDNDWVWEFIVSHFSCRNI